MLSKTRSTSYSPASGLIPDTIPGTVGDRTHVELSVWLVLRRDPRPVGRPGRHGRVSLAHPGTHDRARTRDDAGGARPCRPNCRLRFAQVVWTLTPG
jgi:hypothetical protein